MLRFQNWFLCNTRFLVLEYNVVVWTRTTRTVRTARTARTVRTARRARTPFYNYKKTNKQKVDRRTK